MGWQFREVHRDNTAEKLPKKDFPFKLDDVLPWWKHTREVVQAAGRELGVLC
jgi:hypothetical protein